MTLYERYNKIKFQDHIMQSVSDAAANAEMHDVVTDERAKRKAAEEEVRPFKEYVADAEANAAADSQLQPQPTGTPCRPKHRSQGAN